MADGSPATISRRRFLRRLGIGGSLAAILGGIMAYFWPRDLRDIPAEPVLAGTLADLASKGFLALPYGPYPAIVVNTRAGPAAFSRVCTHFSCTVEYEPDAGRFHCPCHDAFFNGENGDVISGPPNEPLRRFDLFIDGDTIYLGVREAEPG